MVEKTKEKMETVYTKLDPVKKVRIEEVVENSSMYSSLSHYIRVAVDEKIQREGI